MRYIIKIIIIVINTIICCATKFNNYNESLTYDCIIINDNICMPRIGLGTAGLGHAYTKLSVINALDVGYRLFDTAQAIEWYREVELGEALRSYQYDHPIRRDNIFIITKVHPRDFNYDKVIELVKSSIHKLSMRHPAHDYLDMVLLHYPRCFESICKITVHDHWQEAYRALSDLYRQNLIRSIGVSNFYRHDLKQLLNFVKSNNNNIIFPHNVQNYLDPLTNNEGFATLNYCAENNISFTAFSSLGSQHRVDLLNHQVIKGIAQKHKKTSAQILLRFILDLSPNTIIIPRSKSMRHLKENFNVFNFKLDQNDMKLIESIRQ